ncbi:hypothetical protein D3C80_954590 [compost metagenome]
MLAIVGNEVIGVLTQARISTGNSLFGIVNSGRMRQNGGGISAAEPIQAGSADRPRNTVSEAGIVKDLSTSNVDTMMRITCP